jgi:hypothetical protein
VHFGIAQRLAEDLALDFSIAGAGKGAGSPDAQLVSLLIIAASLGFDLERKAEWINWATATAEEDVWDQLAELEDVTEEDILMMRDERLDEYMEWIETKWLDNNPESNGLNPHPTYPSISNYAARRRIPETDAFDVPATTLCVSRSPFSLHQAVFVSANGPTSRPTKQIIPNLSIRNWTPRLPPHDPARRNHHRPQRVDPPVLPPDPRTPSPPRDRPAKS